MINHEIKLWWGWRVWEVHLQAKLYTTAEKRFPHEHFFREKNVDNNRSELSGIVLF